MSCPGFLILPNSVTLLTIHEHFAAVITFPGSYHFGFNTGFNIAESTNFAVPEWIPLGEAADVCMCHPHSVRIQMNRLKMLLDSYEKDMCYRESVGLAKLTYSNWAKHEAKRCMKEMKACANRKIGAGIGEYGSILKYLNLPISLNSGIAVEVTKESLTLVRKSKRKSFRRQELNEWRFAKRVRPGLFVPSTKVICLVECQDIGFTSSSDDFEFFIGTIVKLVDGHVKVHFIGLGKKDDLWLEQSSDHLFLDGGPADPPTTPEGHTRPPTRKRS